ncbi:DUF2917 domain-containing protein [Burkholderia cenocepacia]|uniref:DUF2917 domain-containing protein n=1 Tax=Burkholderia cenocepacia TaxID=95486 RepID=A0A6B2M785_9BURK|nr:DUF2917 domain-containing protein [Burkholderia cenocepacia]MCW3658365.1 hypothetical protein [Burkholderia cenocepacia]MDS0804624.1 hypothetical protein [Burkholderia cenocepacia]NDV70876.1 DUF2917 domain-containing protein [Burkholderia cenocepacia]
MEMTRDHASRLVVCPDRGRADTIALPSVELHFMVAPGKTLTWRAQHDAEIRVRRGDRIWIGTGDTQPAEASIATVYVMRRDTSLERAIARMRDMLGRRGRRTRE